MDKWIWPKWPVVDENSVRFVASGLVNGRSSISGNETNSTSFIRIAEDKIKTLTQTKNAFLTSNGSAALLIALQGLNIGIGDEVILPAFTWVGVATAVLRTGAIPIFIDSSQNSPHMDFQKIEEHISKKTKAIIAPHLYALLFDIGKLKKTFPTIKIIEDCSHCSGLYERLLRPKQLASDIVISSLQATKSLACGEGGFILTSENKMAERILSLRNDSRVYSSSDPVNFQLVPGYYHGANLNLSELQAAFLLDQLEKHEAHCRIRAEGLQFFKNLCADNSGFEVLASHELVRAGNFYAVQVKLKTKVQDFNAYRRSLERKINYTLWDPYTPIPFSKLYRPATLPNHQSLTRQHKIAFRHSFQWVDQSLIIPHHLFLSSKKNLEAIYHAIANSKKSNKQSKSDKNPSVTVIILTKNRKQKLMRAVRSVTKQFFQNQIEILLVGDNCKYLNSFTFQNLPSKITLVKHNIKLDPAIQNQTTVYRVAMLRNVSIQLASKDFICFLDDDNMWEPDHLSSLMDTIITHQCSASYSWRKLYLSNGKPWVPSIWPWTGSSTPQKKLISYYRKLGMLDANTNILKDNFSALYKGQDFSTVDMGAWLFKKNLFNILSFETNYTKEEQAKMVTEDDRLLVDLKKLNFRVQPSEKTTLRYYLGGYSNSYDKK